MPPGGPAGVRLKESRVGLITTESTLSAGTPKLLFERGHERSPVAGANYDVTPDGQRFLMVQASEQHDSAATQIHVVLNWFEELKQRVPTQ